MITASETKQTKSAKWVLIGRLMGIAYVLWYWVKAPFYIVASLISVIADDFTRKDDSTAKYHQLKIDQFFWK